MANYTCTSRTNYFSVTDEDAYAKLFANLISDDPIEDMSETRDGVLYHAFGCFSPVDFQVNDDENNMDTFARMLQQILPENEAFILLEAGNEKLRYIVGMATIITKTTIKCLSLEDIALETCRNILGNDFTTKMSY